MSNNRISQANKLFEEVGVEIAEFISKNDDPGLTEEFQEKIQFFQEILEQYSEGETKGLFRDFSSEGEDVDIESAILNNPRLRRQQGKNPFDSEEGEDSGSDYYRKEERRRHRSNKERKGHRSERGSKKESRSGRSRTISNYDDDILGNVSSKRKRDHNPSRTSKRQRTGYSSRSYVPKMRNFQKNFVKPPKVTLFTPKEFTVLPNFPSDTIMMAIYASLGQLKDLFENANTWEDICDPHVDIFNRLVDSYSEFKDLIEAMFPCGGDMWNLMVNYFSNSGELINTYCHAVRRA